MNVTRSIQLVVKEIVPNTASVDNYVATEISVLHVDECYSVNATGCEGKKVCNTARIDNYVAMEKLIL